MTFAQEFVRCDVDQATAQLVEPLTYVGRDQTFVVPPGFFTDFASVPQVVTWLVPRMGAYTLAAVLHDWLCVRLGLTFEPPPATARDTDGIFRRVMRENGVGLVRRWLMWTAVRWGALTTPARRPGWIKDAPRVLAITLVALPVLAPAAILAALTLAVDVLIEGAVGRWWK